MITKKDRIAIAKNHTIEQSKINKAKIKLSVEHSHIYTSSDIFSIIKSSEKTTISIKDLDTVSAINEISKEKETEYINNIGVLNFASYKHPGGGFINGSMAQEESLCHSSNLYNILSDDAFKPFYDFNFKHTNNGFYLDRAIMTPDVLFKNTIEVNVLTCAAPNRNAASTLFGVSDAANTLALKNRIKFVLSCFADYHCETLILGAFGCGVFGQNPTEVAKIFKELLQNDFSGVFKKVVFAIPNNSNKNFENFKNIFI